MKEKISEANLILGIWCPVLVVLSAAIAVALNITLNIKVTWLAYVSFVCFTVRMIVTIIDERINGVRD